ncbi:unnamed protein product [Dibothriocephalus latus]|uniref:Uncharacterized protein n=1 Tax=Dibothriocephalus latus TaxID=60516 RepID=A0A3P7M3F1_DIBLA|nr:unnamed protein product [Dibothriocephalus latus]
MSEHSVALWDNLPTISEKDSLVRRVTQVSQVKRTNHVLKPAHKHMQTIEGKRAMLIIDSAITRCLLVSAFPKIIENLDVYGLLLGTETVELFKKYAPLVHEYQALTEAEGVVPLTTQALQVSLDLNSPKPRTSDVSTERIQEVSRW